MKRLVVERIVRAVPPAAAVPVRALAACTLEIEMRGRERRRERGRERENEIEGKKERASEGERERMRVGDGERGSEYV